MRRGTWRGYFSNEKGANEEVRDDLRSCTCIRPSNAEEWDNKIADMEERYESAKGFAAAAMDYSEKPQDHAEKLGWVKDYEETIEISLQYKVTWGPAVQSTQIRSDEYMAIARIAQDKAYLAKALLIKAKHRAQWAKEWAKEKEESKNEIPE